MIDVNHNRLLLFLLLLEPASLIAQSQKPVLIEAGRALTRTSAYSNHQGVLVENERIKEVGDFQQVRDHAPKDAVLIDLRHATLLPGLIDCHAHLLAGMDVRLMGNALSLAVTE